MLADEGLQFYFRPAKLDMAIATIFTIGLRRRINAL
jgi:hypothetical protein